MEPRLASSVLVAALRQRAEAAGGFAAVIARGDASAGAVLVLLVQPDGSERLLERILGADGRYAWQQIGETESAGAEGIGKLLDRRRRFDPDLWILELGVASAERFVDQLNELI